MKRIVLVTACIVWSFGCPSSDNSNDDDATDEGSAGSGGAGSGGSDEPVAGTGGKGSAGKGSAGNDSAGSGGDTANPGAIVGHIEVKLTAPTAATAISKAKVGSTAISGKIYDGPVPDETVWDQTAEVGDCKLLTPRSPFCDPKCVSGSVCVEEDECQTNPTPHNLGDIHVKGVKTADGATEFDVTAINNSYANDGTLPFPAFAEGDAISFASAGGDYAPINATLKGIAPLVLMKDDALALESGKPLSLVWTAGASSVPSRILVKLDISHHGGSKGKIECDTADSGSLDIDASLVSKLLELGVAGFPTVILTRTASTTASIAPGLVQFEVSMQQERAVAVPGLTSCTGDEDCEDGEACEADLTCS